MNKDKLVKYFKALGKASLEVKKEKLEVLYSLQEDIQVAENALQQIMDDYKKEEYKPIKKRLKKVKEKVDRKFRDLEP